MSERVTVTIQQTHKKSRYHNGARISKGVQIRDKSGFERLFPTQTSQKTAAIRQV